MCLLQVLFAMLESMSCGTCFLDFTDEEQTLMEGDFEDTDPQRTTRGKRTRIGIQPMKKTAQLGKKTTPTTNTTVIASSAGKETSVNGGPHNPQWSQILPTKAPRHTILLV